MKISGIEVHAKFVKEVKISREDKDFVFKLEAVGDYKEFEKVCPQPQPPVIHKRDGVDFTDFENKDYLELMSEWSDWRISWMVINSIQDVLWDTVKSDPETFGNWEQDLIAAGFSNYEIIKIKNGVLIVNGIMEPERIRQALESSQVGTEVEPATI